MRVFPISAFTDNYIWLIVDGNAAVCVDPGDAQPVIDRVNQYHLNLIATLITHHHADHVGGLSTLVEFNPNMLVYGPHDARIPFLTHPVEDKMSCLNNCHFKILKTPGHTSTHISYYEPSLGWLFCGDTLFSAGCGRVFDGTIEELYHSLQSLKALPDNTKVFCAHEYTRQNLRFAESVEPHNTTILRYAKELAQHHACTLPSTIELEKKINPFFHAELEVFKKLRRNKDVF